MLSMLIYDSPEGEVKGINELQEQYIQQYGYDDYIPNVVLLFWSFRIMIACGVAMIGAMILAGFFILYKTFGKCSLALKYFSIIIAIAIYSKYFWLDNH